MTGRLALLAPPPAAPPPAAGAWADLLEVAFATQPMSPSPVWVNITPWLVPGPVEVTFGRPDEFSEAAPATVRFTLNNEDGRFTQGLATSPYFPNVRNGRRVRWSRVNTATGATWRRFDGHVNEWPTEWAHEVTAWAEAAVTATDRLKRLGTVGELRSMAVEEVLRDSAGVTVPGSSNVLNGTFESSIENWKVGTGGTAARSSDVAQGGSWALKLTADGTGVLWALNDDNAQAAAVATAPGDVWSLGGWLRAGGADTSPGSHSNTVGSASCSSVGAITDVTGGVRQQQGLDAGQSAVDYNKLVGFFTDTDEWLELVNGTVPANKFAYIDVHWNIGPSAVAQIKAVHPASKVLAYQNLGGMIAGPHTNSRPTTLVTQEEATAHGTGADDWRCHKASDHTVAVFNDFTYLQFAEIGRASWRTQASAHFAGIKADGFDGVFLDDVNMSKQHGFDTIAFDEFATDNAYRDAVTAAMAALKPAAAALGLTVAANVGMNPWDTNHYPGFQTMLSARSIDVASREFWTNWAASAVYYDGATWTDTMKVLTDANAAGAGAMLNSYPLSTPDDTRSIRYGLASFYLHWDGTAPSGFGYNDGQPLSASGTYRKLLGTPTEAKQLVSGTTTDGAWMRHFTGGVACVNAKSTAGTVTFSLGGTYLDAGGSPVTSVGLAAATGMVLLSQVPPPVGSVAAPSVQTDWAVIGGSYTSCRWTLRPDLDPSPNGYFWAGQGSFLPSPGGDVWYCGLQSGGNIPSPSYSGKLAIFSVWNAVAAAAAAGVPGAWAGAFSGEGAGYSARVPYAWQAGRTYQLKVTADTARGTDWWRAEVTDTQTGQTTVIGSVQAQAAAGDIFGGISQWTEYFSNPGTFTLCDQIPGSDVTFGTPVFSTGGTPRPFRPVLRCLDAGNGYLTQVNGTLAADTADWAQYKLEGVTVPFTPAGIAKVIAQFETTTTPASGEAHYLDTVQLVKAATLAGGAATQTGAVPAACYPLDDPQGATSAANVTRYIQDAAAVRQAGAGGEAEFGAGTGPGADQASALVLTPTTGTAGAWLEAALRAPVGGPAGAVSLEAWFRTADTLIFNRLICELRDAAGATVCLAVATDGQLEVTGRRAGGTETYNLVSGVQVSDALTHHAAVTEQLTGQVLTIRVYLDGAQVASTTLGSTGLPAFRTLAVGGRPKNTAGYGMFNGTLALVSCLSAALPAARVADHWHAGTDGLAGERTDQRIGRIADYLAIPAADRALDAGDSTVGAQATAGTQPLEAMREAERTESGVLFLDTAALLTFHRRSRRYNASPAVTLDAAARQLAEPPRFPADDFGLTNDMTVNRPQASPARAVNQPSVDEYGLYRDAKDVISDSDSAAMSAAQWRVNTYGDPRTRVPNIVVDLLTLDQIAPAQVPLLLGVTIGSKLRVTGLPAQAPASQVDVFVEGWTETAALGVWRIAFNTSPADTSQVWQLGVAGYSELGVTTRLGQ